MRIGRIGVDLCNTVADVNAEIKKVLGLPEDYVFREYGPGGLNIDERWFREHPEVFRNAVPLPDAPKGLNLLATAGAKIYYVTARPEWARSITENWLREYGFPHGQLLMEADKVRAYRCLDLHLFFEDAPGEIECLERAGANVVAVAQPYNKGTFRWEDMFAKGGGCVDLLLHRPGMLPVLSKKVLLSICRTATGTAV